MSDSPIATPVGDIRAIPMVALDLPSADAALSLARALGDRCRFYKVGCELFTATGPSIVHALRDEIGAEVFLDLKFHDIPNTVAGAVRSAARLGARLTTVHASGGTPMLEAARKAAWDAAGDACGVLGVTALTSLDRTVLAAAWGRTDGLDMEREVLRLAGLAADAGLHGIVCSGAEVGAVRSRYGDRLAPLVPGIRLEGGEVHDQQRVMTPAAAQAAGARYLVLGRAVTDAQDPAKAMERALAELFQAS
ncbi:MAG TPA: orotidine-5'-phosphate decarboxylase [Gemmatimonadaceae bacterium]|nr:orotidine-5'-phosphate decarboxylase [Gemmatimonadaceae bacterium]